MITTPIEGRKPSKEIEPHFMKKAEYLVIDIETGDAAQKYVTAAMNRWKPPANVKDETKIAERRTAATAKIVTKSALLDAAPIVCLGIKSDKMGIIFNGMCEESFPVDGAMMVSAKDEKGMLLHLRTWLDAVCDQNTLLLGFNSMYFDFPKIRFAYVKNRLKLPIVFSPRQFEANQPQNDVMKMFLKFFTSEKSREFYISLDQVIDRLELPSYKGSVSGAEVPRLHREGDYKTILTYVMVDVLATWAAYLLMSSRSGDME